MQVFRILLVEDYPPFRRFVRAELQRRPEFQVVGEVSDGQEAIQRAQELRPDLVLLDISLPTLNGVEAARRIHQLVPQARLLFVSQDSSPEVVREILKLGAAGYVHKLRAQSDLLPALDAVLAGGQFVSQGLEPTRTTFHGRHEVQFYSEDAVFLESTVHFIGGALTAGNPAVVIATKDHRRGLTQRLRKLGFDIDTAIRQGTYIGRDAAGTLSQVMVDDRPDLVRFLDGLKGLIDSACRAAAAGPQRVAVFGECVGLLCAADRTDAAIELEQAGNRLLETHNVDIFCAYPLSCFHGRADDAGFKSICHEHTAVYSK